MSEPVVQTVGAGVIPTEATIKADQSITAQAATTATMSEQKPEVMSKDEVKALIEAERKAWQSRFDKVLEEKKQEKEKVLTTEERLARMEQERKAERIDWSRKEAKAKASISDSIEKAILMYHSENPEDISAGAVELRKAIDSEIATYKAQIEQLEKQIKYGSKAPSAGVQAAPQDIKAQYESAMKAGNVDLAIALKRQMAS